MSMFITHPALVSLVVLNRVIHKVEAHCPAFAAFAFLLGVILSLAAFCFLDHSCHNSTRAVKLLADAFVLALLARFELPLK